MKNQFIHVEDIKLPVYIYYEKRKNSRVSIGKKAVYIRIPVMFSNSEKQKQVSVFIDWAQRKLQKHAHRFSKKPARKYKDGDSITLGENIYHLKLNYRDKKTSSARLVNNCIILSISDRLSEMEKAEHISTLLSRCIGKHRLSELTDRVFKLNRKYFRRKIGKIKFKYNKTRWGSCSLKGNINISTRLLFAPDDVLEYVCIHELAHLIEPNHSWRFWNLVKKVIPDYQEKEKWLKDNQDKCWF